ncbi:Sua5/YciO/YrdC/YwlC family protein [Paenibacillus curdlanolyticus YK9]|uniref:Threonylcarbamoyl-AMP synthase n=1 Tax=Paenibacillus curdlanolyticus YK9 TaxID=717606 RepID=E0IEL5_9BACL|nr:L-threonylcarbamoyladenylate synthase [Paenibacillus curdlanolyticus]EFM09103.1 Sua5/YciO/YrdC/YwlC family protein [Paenibacillus curdlanolyticus YK9]
MTIKTQFWQVKADLQEQTAADEAAIAAAAELLRTGGTVAFPTETVYGLGADARQTSAVENVFVAKGRPSDNPLIVHIADEAQLRTLVKPYGDTERALMRRFWPGPLTLVLPALEGAVSPRVTAGLDTVAVRMPDHAVALRLIAESGCPVAAPSANRSGRPSPTVAEHVREDLNGRIDGIVDGGPTGVGLESTVVQVEAPGVVRILRPGGITPVQLREAAPTVLLDESLEALERKDATMVPQERAVVSDSPAVGTATAVPAAAPRSPGMKYTHYAPRGSMQLVHGEPDDVRAYITKALQAAAAEGEITGVLTYDEHAASYHADAVISCGSLMKLETAAQGLYAALREFDARGVQRIWAEACSSDGIGLALMNRLEKAAGHQIVYLT